MNWLRDKTQGKKKIDWNDMSVHFETRFGLHRKYTSMIGKARDMQLAGKKEEAASKVATGKEQ
jgi:hypothetical protein